MNTSALHSATTTADDQRCGETEEHKAVHFPASHRGRGDVYKVRSLRSAATSARSLKGDIRDHPRHVSSHSRLAHEGRDALGIKRRAETSVADRDGALGCEAVSG